MTGATEPLTDADRDSSQRLEVALDAGGMGTWEWNARTNLTAIRDPEVSAKLRGMAVNPGGTPSDEFRAMIDADIKSYEAVVKAANLKFEE